MEEGIYHVPVLLHEVINGLQIIPSGIYVDCTFGGGGHSKKFLEQLNSKGKLIVFDQDEDAKKNLPPDERVIFVPHNFRHLQRFLRFHKIAKVNGILVQLPLPKHIDEQKVICAIDPRKDVDAFHPETVGRLMTGRPVFLPCTPAGVMELIKESGIEIKGKECVVVGRSNIVGKPQAILLLAKDGTVTICHSKTKNLGEVCRRADVLVVAIGKPEFIKGNDIKPGAIVIDVGMNRREDKKLVGDVEFSSASAVASAITPVPGGVGPMTIAMLMKNTVKAACLQAGRPIELIDS